MYTICYARILLTIELIILSFHSKFAELFQFEKLYEVIDGNNSIIIRHGQQKQKWLKPTKTTRRENRKRRNFPGAPLTTRCGPHLHFYKVSLSLHSLICHLCFVILTLRYLKVIYLHCNYCSQNFAGCLDCG